MKSFLSRVVKGKIFAFCHQWKIAKLDFFGSFAGGNFVKSSDVDVLVTFNQDANWGLLDHLTMEQELSKIMGRHAEIFNRQAVEHSSNWIRRKSILETAQPYYVAR